MRIGITGVTGFVGQRLAERAKAEGWDVVGYTRRSDRSIPNVTETRNYGQPDISGLDALVHLAGESILGVWTGEKKRRIRESRVSGTRMMVSAMEKLEEDARPKVFVGGSATGYYGDRADDWLPESEPAGEGFLAEVCRDWERETRRAESLGVRTVRGRIGVVLGPGGGSAAMLGTVFKSGLGGKLGDGKQWFPWVGLDDLTRMFMELVRNPSIEGPVNLVSREPVRNAELTATLGRVLKRPAFLPVPAFAVRLVFREMSEMLLNSQRAKPEALTAAGFEWEQAEVEPVLRWALGK